MSKKHSNGFEMEEPAYPSHVREKPAPVPFSKFLHNSEAGTYLGRTPSSWGKQEVMR